MPDFDAVDLAKVIIGFAVTAGTNKIVKAIINSTVVREKLFDKVVVYIAGFAISMTVSDLLRDVVDGKIDGAVKIARAASDEAN